MSNILEVQNKEISVEQIRNDWAMVLMTRGVIAKLLISKWSAYAKLTPEILGLKFTSSESYKFSKKYLSLGKQRLLPPDLTKEIGRTEYEARANLSNHSFHTVWGNFIPFVAFDEWEKQNSAIRSKFMEQAMVLGNKYDEIINTVSDEYGNLAKDVWARLYPTNVSGPPPSFMNEFVNKIIEKIPPREEIVSSFKYDVTYFIIPMPSFVEEDLAKANKIRIQTDAEKHNAELERETKRRISEDYISKKRELIDGFLESTVVHMRKYISEICDGVLRSIGKSSAVNSLTMDGVNKIKSMIKKVKVLNFYDDSEISDLFSQLENEMDKIKGEMDEDAIVTKLKEIVEISAKEFVPKNFNPSISVLEP